MVEDFCEGDAIVYPNHGVGTIERIEEREILGEVRTYFSISLPHADIRALVPIDAMHKAGVRGLMDPDAVPALLELLRQPPESIPKRWQHRRRLYAQKLATGDAFEVAEVMRDLTLLQAERDDGLARRDRQMLENARELLVQELALIQERDVDQVRETLEAAVADAAEAAAVV